MFTVIRLPGTGF